MFARFIPRVARFASRFLRRKRPMFKRRPIRRRVYRKKTQNKVHSYIRWADKDTQYPGSNGPNSILETGSDHHLAYTFKLDNVTNPSDFTNLYDMYKINKVVLHLEPIATQSGLISNTGSLNYQNRKLRVVHDYNDANLLTDEDQYLEYSNCKSYSPVGRRPIKITLYPKISNTVLDAGGAPAYTAMNSGKVWLNIENDEVPHFGLKIFVPGGISNVVDSQLFRVRAKFHLSLKNSK